MNVELSERARKRIENLVRDGAYPSAEAAVEAAVDALDHPDLDGIDAVALARQARDARDSGRTREWDDEYRAEVRARVAKTIDSKRHS
jgi:Arc/MetJ-type ribon-helix-helix transcriptional regulator